MLQSLRSIAFISTGFLSLWLRLVWECFEQTTAMSSQDEQSRRVVLVRKKPVAGRIWKSLKWDVCIETHKLLQHWFAWQILCGTTYFLQASISTCSKCGVISRHITTRVFSLFNSSGLSALCCLFKPEWFVYAAWKVVDWFWRWCLELELLLLVWVLRECFCVPFAFESAQVFYAVNL